MFTVGASKVCAFLQELLQGATHVTKGSIRTRRAKSLAQLPDGVYGELEFTTLRSVKPRASDLNDGRKALWTASAAHLDASKIRRCRCGLLAVDSALIAVRVMLRASQERSRTC